MSRRKIPTVCPTCDRLRDQCCDDCGCCPECGPCGCDPVDDILLSEAAQAEGDLP